MIRVDNGAASNLIPTVEKNDEDEDAENASETSAIRISKKAEGASQVSNAERFTVPDNTSKLLIDTTCMFQNNDVEEYVDDVRLTPSAPPCDDDEHDLRREDDTRLTSTAPTPDRDERSIEHELRRDDDARLTPTAPPRGDEERSIGHALRICTSNMS
ncbi:hypothetical protein SNE40_008680 [Patella caerulea]|uniref:Uncharacterized protein n=1 Tax=Patella caerulea TaxID=87958 RepID=A0AAN8Q1Y9_PATCE